MLDNVCKLCRRIVDVLSVVCLVHVAQPLIGCGAIDEEIAKPDALCADIFH